MSPLNLESPAPPAYHLEEEQEDEFKCSCDNMKQTIECGHKIPQMEKEKLVDSDTDTTGSGISPSETEVVVPPDGGWGWVVVFASFMCNLIIDGIIFSFGTFLVHIAEEFSVTKAEVTLVGSLMSGFYLIAGPFASAISNRYGFRSVAIFGSVLAAAAFAMSNFATSVTFLCVTYGLIGGVGFGFMYVPSVITIGFYFERWRALATGIAVCGSGIGTFIFAPLSEILITNLGWRGALLFQGGLVLTCVIYGSLFRPLTPTKINRVKAEEKEDLIMDPSKLRPETLLKLEEAMRLRKSHSLHSINDHQSSIPKLFGVNNNSDYPRLSEVYHTISIPNRKTEHSYYHEKTLSVPFLANHEKSVSKNYLVDIKKLKPIILPKRDINSQNTEVTEVNRPLYRDDIFFNGSLARLPQYTSKSSIAYHLSVTRLPTKNDIEEEKKHKCKLCPEALRRVLATMLDVSLLKSPSFLILAIGGFFTMMGFYVPYMYLVDRARDNGMSKMTAVWLVSSIGIANTFGRVLCGVVSSFPGVNALFLTNIALTIGGIATILSGLSLGAEYQFFYSVVFGLAISCFASLRSIVVVDLLGLEKLTNAFGLILLFQGVAAIIGAPLAGTFMNATGSYDTCFYLSGGVLLFSAIMCYPLNWVNQWERKRNMENQEIL